AAQGPAAFGRLPGRTSSLLLTYETGLKKLARLVRVHAYAAAWRTDACDLLVPDPPVHGFGGHPAQRRELDGRHKRHRQVGGRLAGRTCRRVGISGRRASSHRFLQLASQIKPNIRVAPNYFQPLSGTRGHWRPRADPADPWRPKCAASIRALPGPGAAPAG